jgi:ABC-type polysaccharide/polyol phosphate transport system ATPase subunit
VSSAEVREPVVIVEGVSKKFRIPQERVHTLKERALHPFRHIAFNTFDALKDISFEVGEGEFFGIVGRNGSGKSTLLKMLAGIYGSDGGSIAVRGRMSTFIELGVGFNPDLAAYDNVLTNAIMLGLTPKEAAARYDKVIQFAELEEFQDLKIKNYSSGMLVRLAFSVAIEAEADILLIDEVLAVGDAAFQQKCFDVFNEMRDSGKTIIFVTHDMGALQRFCHRALLLERGRPVHLGEPHEVADRYLELNFGRDPDAIQTAGADGQRSGDGEARVVEVWVQDGHGERNGVVLQGERMSLHAKVKFMVPVDDPAASLYILNDEHKTIAVATTEAVREHSGSFSAGDEVVFSFAFDNVLAPGRYTPMVNLAHRGYGLDVIDRFEGGFSFLVTATAPQGGLVDLPMDVAITRVDSALARETL